MTTDIVRAAEQSRHTLERIRQMLQDSACGERMYPVMKQAICEKLMIPVDETDEISRLVILSIRKQDRGSVDLPDGVIRSRIDKYDCHQTSLVSQKKTLLIMFVEKELGLHFSDDDAVSVQTVPDLCARVCEYWEKRVD